MCVCALVSIIRDEKCIGVQEQIGQSSIAIRREKKMLSFSETYLIFSKYSFAAPLAGRANHPCGQDVGRRGRSELAADRAVSGGDHRSPEKDRQTRLHKVYTKIEIKSDKKGNLPHFELLFFCLENGELPLKVFFR